MVGIGYPTLMKYSKINYHMPRSTTCFHSSLGQRAIRDGAGEVKPPPFPFLSATVAQLSPIRRYRLGPVTKFSSGVLGLVSVGIGVHFLGNTPQGKVQLLRRYLQILNKAGFFGLFQAVGILENIGDSHDAG